MISETDAKRIVETIADEVRSDAKQLRLSRAIKLVLDSFSYDHIFTELLQNADDCENATAATIEVTDEAIFFIHNGKPFDEPDLRAICDIGVTTKKPNAHIGYMGIGFKAAFKLSDTPYVFSGPFRFHFTREDVIVPYWVEKIPDEVKTRLTEGVTLFYLPFRKDFPRDVIQSFISLLYEVFEPVCMVFLRRLVELSVVSNNNVRMLRKDIIQKDNAKITETIGDKKRTFEYFVFRRTAQISETAKADPRAKDSKRSELETTDILVVLNAKDGRLSPLRSVLYTFLPTPYDTGLRFAVNCDFLLNTQRTEPDWTSPWNRWLFDEIHVTLKDVVNRTIKDRRQRFGLYELMPRRNEVSKDLINILVVPLIDFLKGAPLVLTSDNQLALPRDVALASKEVQCVIPPERAGVKKYVHPNVSGGDFLRDELSVKDIISEKEEKQFVLDAFHDEKWLSTLPPHQIKDLYELLFQKMISEEAGKKWSLDWWERKSLIEELKKLKIAKCFDGALHTPQDTILPTKKETIPDVWSLPCLHIVDGKVLSRRARQFLKELGTRDFSEDSLALRILESHEKDEPLNWSEEHKLACLKFFADYLHKKTTLPQAVEAKLGSLFLPIEGQRWAHANICYKPDERLKKLLPQGSYVDFSRLHLSQEFQEVLKKLDVVHFPRVMSFGKGSYNAPNGFAEESWRKYWFWLSEESFRSYEGHSHEVSESYRLESFDEYASSEDESASKEYFFYIIHHWDEYYKAYMKAPFNWFHYTSHSKDVPSYFIFQLKTCRWLPTTQGLKVPSETFFPTREIKRIAGHVVPFVELSQEEMRSFYEFFEFIGVTTKLDIDSLHEVLEKARSFPITEEFKKQLEMLYERLYVEIEKFSDGEKPVYEWHLLARNEEFLDASKLFWIDDPELEEQFGTELSIAWVPSNLARPQLERLFGFLGVSKVSTILRRNLSDGVKAENDTLLTQRIKKAADYVYSVLSHYCAEKLDAFPSFVDNLRVFRTDNLIIKISLSNVQKKTVCSCFCDVDDCALYVSSTAHFEDISREIARAFGASLDSAFPIEIVLSEEDRYSAAERLRRSSIQVLQLPTKEPISEPEVGVKTVIPPRPCEKPAEPYVLEKIPEEPHEHEKVEEKPELTTIPRPQPLEPRETVLHGPPEIQSIEPQIPRTKPPSIVEKEYVGPRPTTRVDHKPFEIEEKARKHVIEYETEVEQRDVQVVSNWANLGYDLISRGKDGSVRYIEVKGSAEDFDELGLTESQFEASKTYRDKYFIYRVAFTDSSPIIYVIQDPYPELEEAAEPVKSYRIRGWAALFAHKLKTLRSTKEKTQ